MTETALGQKRSDTPIAWNDIEALPVYAAAIIVVVVLASHFINLFPPLQATSLKVVGIVGGLALRHAWLGLHAEDDGGA